MNNEEMIDIQRQDAHSILESLEYHLNHPPNTIIWEFRMGSSQVELLCAYVRQLEENNCKLQARCDRYKQKVNQLETNRDEAIEILKLCNSQCSKETISILERGKE